MGDEVCFVVLRVVGISFSFVFVEWWNGGWVVEGSFVFFCFVFCFWAN